ncbi:unnamed protein product, partial [Rotaria sp. Silwood2]
IFNDKQELISQLNGDILFNSKITPMSIAPLLHINEREMSSRNLNKEQALFMWYQLLIEILKRIYTKTENEVLFTLGAIFQINFVEELTDSIWHVKLTLCDNNETDLNLNELIDNLKSDIVDIPDTSSLAKILIEINELDKAKYLLNLILKDLPLDHCDRISIKNNIRTIHFTNGNYG